ncbi:MAG: co-chaperone GroES family protein [Candidatus Omnitrophota bacterium]
MNRELLIVGDRVLVSPDEGHDRTDAGLYLPQGVQEKEKIQGGKVVKTGPGYPIPDPAAMEIEPWQSPKVESRYFPLQAREGDYCIFLRNAGVEIEFEKKKYIIVPHSAILVLVRDEV